MQLQLKVIWLFLSSNYCSPNLLKTFVKLHYLLQSKWNYCSFLQYFVLSIPWVLKVLLVLLAVSVMIWWIGICTKIKKKDVGKIDWCKECVVFFFFFHIVGSYAYLIQLFICISGFTSCQKFLSEIIYSALKVNHLVPQTGLNLMAVCHFYQKE